jgi:hypothetical protein
MQERPDVIRLSTDAEYNVTWLNKFLQRLIGVALSHQTLPKNEQNSDVNQ